MIRNKLSNTGKSTKDKINKLKIDIKKCEDDSKKNNTLYTGYNKPIKKSSTIINKDYHVSKQEYLQHKMNKYKDNAWIHNPSNAAYQMEGAASSSQRIETLKHVSNSNGVTRRLLNDKVKYN
jgi:hypothetical protein